MYAPFTDPSLSPPESARLGAIWLSYYFTPVPDLDVVTDELVAARVGQHESTASQENTLDADKTPTLLKMSAEEAEAISDPEALVRTSIPFLRIVPSVYARNFEKAFFDTSGVLPRVDIVVAWGAETFPLAVWGAKTFLDRVKAEQPREKHKREIAFYRLEGCNHFVSVDISMDLHRVLSIVISRIGINLRRLSNLSLAMHDEVLGRCKACNYNFFCTCITNVYQQYHKRLEFRIS